MSHQQFLETWFRRIWEEEDLSAVDEMMLDTAPVEGLGSAPFVGPAEFKAFAQTLMALLCTTRVTIENLMEDGERVAFLMKIDATCQRTGKPVQTHGMAMALIRDGKIVQAHNQVDFISLFAQLGLLPADTMATCMSGNSPA